MLHYPLIHKGVNSARMITRARILTTLVTGGLAALLGAAVGATAQGPRI